MLFSAFVSIQRMVKQRNLPFSFKPEQGSRVGLISCHVVLIDTDPLPVLHVARQTVVG
jgi:hypothetical protein